MLPHKTIMSLIISHSKTPTFIDGTMETDKETSYFENFCYFEENNGEILLLENYNNNNHQKKLHI